MTEKSFQDLPTGDQHLREERISGEDIYGGIFLNMKRDQVRLPDGQMAAMLSLKDTIVIGYSGKYEINTKESIVTHFRDFYSYLPHPRPDIVPIFIRDYSFSQDFQVLILKPKELKGQELIWKKVNPQK